MTKKKEPTILGLPPLPPAATSFASTDLAAYTPNRSIAPRERAIWEEAHEDKVIITAIDNKGQYGLEKMNEMKWFAVNDTFFTMQQIEEVRLEAQGTGCQGAMDEFCRYMTALSARHTLGVVEVSAGKIAEVIAEPVLPPAPPPAPPERKGFWARVLGG